MSTSGTRTSVPGMYPMKPLYIWLDCPLSPNVISEKSEEASRVRSYDFSRLLDSTVDSKCNTAELAMKQMP